MIDQNKSDPSSWETWVEQLTSLPEDLQMQELLLKAKEQQQQILNLLSEKSELQSLIQDLQSQIQQQEEQIVTQNESDQELQTIIRKKEEFKREKEWVERQTSINKIERHNIELDKRYLKILVKEESDKVIRRYRRSRRAIIILLLIVIEAINLLFILWQGI